MELDKNTLKQVGKVIAENTLMTADEYTNEKVIIEYIDNLIDLSIGLRVESNTRKNEYSPTDKEPFKMHRNQLIVSNVIEEANSCYEQAEIAEFIAYSMAKSIGYKPDIFEYSEYQEIERMAEPKNKGER